MSRELEFRVWDKKRGLYHSGCDNLCLSLGGRLMWQFGYNAPDMLDKEECEKYVIEQFTGLHDNAGKEIYEGDIIQFGDIRGTVCWREELSSFSINAVGWMYGHFFGEGVEAKECTVIGNIHEGVSN